MTREYAFDDGFQLFWNNLEKWQRKWHGRSPKDYFINVIMRNRCVWNSDNN